MTSRMQRAKTRPDGGSASLWVLACGVLVLVIAGVAVLRDEAVLARHRAESAADLAALAAAGQIGVSEDVCAAAASIASMNSVELVSCQPRLTSGGRSGDVVVAVTHRLSLVGVGSRAVYASARAGRGG